MPTRSESWMSSNARRRFASSILSRTSSAPLRIATSSTAESVAMRAAPLPPLLPTLANAWRHIRDSL